MSKAALDRLLEKHPVAIVSTHAQHGDETAVIKREHALEVMRFLRDDDLTRFELLADLTAVDYLGVREPRFEVVYHLRSLSRGHRIRIKVQVPEHDPVTPSVIEVWRTANWLEREVWDLYGIRFEGHPDLRRVLLYPEFEGHPLRKDYPLEQRQPLIPPRSGREHL